MNRECKFRCNPVLWTKGSHSLIEAGATWQLVTHRTSGLRTLMGLLYAFHLGEAGRMPFLHADLFLCEPRGEAFGLGLFGECLAL